MRKLFIGLMLVLLFLCGCDKKKEENNSILKCIKEVLSEDEASILNRTSYIIFGDYSTKESIAIKDEENVNNILNYIKSAREKTCEFTANLYETYLYLDLYDKNDKRISHIKLNLPSDIGFIVISYYDDSNKIYKEKNYYIDGGLFENVFDNFISNDTH